MRAIGFATWLVFASVTASFGQAVTSGTGAINGRVADASSAVVPGVTVTLTSPSLHGGPHRRH